MVHHGRLPVVDQLVLTKGVYFMKNWKEYIAGYSSVEPEIVNLFSDLI